MGIRLLAALPQSTEVSDFVPKELHAPKSKYNVAVFFIHPTAYYAKFGQNYFPDGMTREQFYAPKGEGREREIKARLERWAKQWAQAKDKK
ncbi:MAG: hypothetical protein L3J05_04845 [Robiginitomaculum sp.]|nr:hypothetical protein [Robiginitomaculum sp.]